MTFDDEMVESGQPPVIWIAAPGISENCALCKEPIIPGETIVEGVEDELLHLVCVEFEDEVN